MPRRTNAFQQLVAWLQRWIHDPDISITESAMIRNHDTEVDTEVDVLVEFTKGENFQVGFECRDHKRKAGPQWIAELYQKRLDCRLDKMVAVHSVGFTAPAVKSAQKKGIVTLTVRDLVEDIPAECNALQIQRLLAEQVNPVVRHALLVTPDELSPTHLAAGTKVRDLSNGKEISFAVLCNLILSNFPPPQRPAGSEIERWFDFPRGLYVLMDHDRQIPLIALLVKIAFVKGAQGAPRSITELPSKVARVIFAEGTLPTASGLSSTWAVHDSSGKDSLIVLGPPSDTPYEINAGLDVTSENPDTGELETTRIPSKPTKCRGIKMSVQKCTLMVGESGKTKTVDVQVDQSLLVANQRIVLDDVLRVELPKALDPELWLHEHLAPMRKEVAFSPPGLYLDGSAGPLPVRSVTVTVSVESAEDHRAE